jgi:hypothetical protein
MVAKMASLEDNTDSLQKKARDLRVGASFDFGTRMESAMKRSLGKLAFPYPQT